jgi:predicted DNA-binding protein
MVVRSIRLEPVLAERVDSYASASGKTKADATRALIERGLASEALSVYATPVGQLIKTTIEAEFALMREDAEERDEHTENRLAKICAKGSKASIAAVVMSNDAFRALVPAWRDVPAEKLFSYYAHFAGELQAGRSYKELRTKKDE